MCARKQRLFINHLPHSVHRTWFFSRSWWMVAMCSCKLVRVAKLFAQIWQICESTTRCCPLWASFLWVLSPLPVSYLHTMAKSKHNDCEILFVSRQTSCCIFVECFRRQTSYFRLQILQMYCGRSSAGRWRIICIRYAFFQQKRRPHSLHPYGFSLSGKCVVLWACRNVGLATI